MVAEKPDQPSRRPGRSIALALTAVFSATIAVATIFSIPLPPPLYEITWAPAIYLALGALTDPVTAFAATGFGSFVGEAFNVSFKGGGSPIYPAGMVWARAPEVLIIAWAKNKGNKALVLAMVAATVYETLAFFFSDWYFYTAGLFQYQVTPGYSPLVLASFDFGTLADLAYIPVALAVIRAARPSFKRLGFD
ncbi:MAG TPA: hypothetical protein VKF15_06645 [Nitrososphaerales archaeon]|nr:hypothetical protein [Nitrososphaerales archaeon]